MTIDRLGSVDPVNRINKTQKASKPSKTEKSDNINLSNEARKQAELLKISEAVKAAPDVRMDRIEEVKAKLKDPGYLDSAVDETAGRILDIFGI